MPAELDLGPLQSSPGLDAGALQSASAPPGPITIDGSGAAPVEASAATLAAGAFILSPRLNSNIDLGALQTFTAGLDLGALQSTDAAAPLQINGAGQAPVGAVATALTTGGELSGIPALAIRGSVQNPVEASAATLSAGASLVTPGLAAATRGIGSWWWIPAELGFRLLKESLNVKD